MNSVNLTDSTLLGAVASLVRYLAPSTLLRLCDALENLPATPTPNEILHVSAIIVDEESRAVTDRVLVLWNKESKHIPAQTFAWMLRSAATADAWRNSQQQIEAVWTGPGSRAANLRRTDAALIELIDSATEELWMVTFAAYRVDPVLSALNRALHRGVKILFVGESSKENSSLTSGGVSELRAHLPDAVTIYIWPQENRQADASGRTGALHAKIAIADGKVALISSANLSDSAMSLNIEAGTLVYGGDVPIAFEAELRRLVSIGILRKL